jgi:hypothetical protein
MLTRCINGLPIFRKYFAETGIGRPEPPPRTRSRGRRGPPLSASQWCYLGCFDGGCVRTNCVAVRREGGPQNRDRRNALPFDGTAGTILAPRRPAVKALHYRKNRWRSSSSTEDHWKKPLMSDNVPLSFTNLAGKQKSTEPDLN